MGAILAKVPQRKALGGYLARALQETGDSMKISLNRTTLYWVRPVAFKRILKGTTSRYSVAMVTVDPLWITINEGTATVDVLFSKNYTPKTKPGELYGYPGQGKVIKRGVPGQPGIIARRWTDALVVQEQPRMIRRLQRAVDAYVKANL